MTPIELDTAIALALGYTYEDKSILYDGEAMTFRLWRTPSGGGMGRNWPPRYSEDLNAMHEAEKSLPDYNLYRRFLYLVALDDPSNIQNEPAWTTAAQRAEAFLYTIGKMDR
jgi:hypothetical protein